MNNKPLIPTVNDVPMGMQLLHTLTGHTKQIGRIAWSHDGHKLATPADDGKVRIWDPLQGQLLRELDEGDTEVYSVSWSPDNRTLLTGSRNETIHIWDTETGQKQPQSLDVGSIVWGVQHSPCGQWAAVASTSHELLIWDLLTYRQLPAFSGHSSIVTSVAWSPDGSMIATTSDDATVRVWSFPDGECLHTFEKHASWCETVTWSDDQQTLISACGKGEVRFWSLETGKAFRPMIQLSEEMIVWLGYTLDRSMLVGKSLDAHLYFWYTDTWKLAAVLPEPTRSFIYTGCAFHPHKPYLASLGEEHTIVRIWDYSQLQSVRQNTWGPFLQILETRKAILEGSLDQWREHIEDSLFE